MITRMVETATAATAIEKGDTPEGANTLGGINLMVARADERMKDVPKFARPHAKELCPTGCRSGAATERERSVSLCVTAGPLTFGDSE